MAYTDSEADGYGEIHGDATWGFCVDVTASSGASGNQSVDWSLTGDGWGGEPHTVTGTLTIEELLPDVYVSPDYQTLGGFSGELITYTFNLENQTGASATFSVNVLANWATSAPSSIGPVANGANVDLDVVVTIPGSASVHDQDIAEITVESGTYSDTVMAETEFVPDRWVGVSPLPVASTRLAVVGNGTYLYAQGGQNSLGTNLATLSRYDPATDSWTGLADAPGSRSNHEMCEMNGHLYTGMGYGGSSPFDSALWDYNIATDSWSTLGSVPGTARLWAPHVCSPTMGTAGTLFIIGGYDGSDGVATVNAYDVGSDSWSTLTDLPEITYGADAAIIGHVIYVKPGGSTTIYTYDLAQGSGGVWNTVTEAFNQPGYFGASIVKDGAWYLAGNGFGGDTDSAAYYNPSTNSWAAIASLLAGRYHVNGGYAGGSVYAVAGQTDSATVDNVEKYEQAPGMSYNGVLGKVYSANDPTGTVPFATISLTPGDYSTESDGSGAYALTVPGRTYTITVQADGYADREVFVDLSSGNLVQDLTLESAEVEAFPGNFVDALVAGSGSAVHTLSVSNTGNLDLSFNLLEVPPGVELSDHNIEPGRLYPDLPTKPSYETYIAGPIIVDQALQTEIETSGRADLFIWMRERADLSPAFNMSNRNERRIWVYNTLKETAERSQHDVVATLKKMGYDYDVMVINNSILVHDADPALLETLSERADIHRLRGVYTQMHVPEPERLMVVKDQNSTVLGSTNVNTTTAWSVRIVDADDVWTNLGITGKGVVVANIDTGVQYDHPALLDSYRGNLGGSFDHHYNWYAPTSDAGRAEQCDTEYDASVEPCDSDGHGSHVMGSMVGGDGNAPFSLDIGMAPDAKWIACMGCDRSYPGGPGGCSDAALTGCADWILAPTYETMNGTTGDPTMAPDLVNNSWGGGTGDNWYRSYVDAWRAADIIPLFAAGNDGPGCGTVSSPGDYDNVITVGGTDDQNRNYASTSRGPAASGTGFSEAKPDITAPGEDVISSVPGNGYANYSGTSMATPHAAGLVALLRSANPSLTYNQIYSILTTTAYQTLSIKNGELDGCGGGWPNYPNYVFGYGRIDAYQAVQAALEMQDLSWLSTSPTTGTIAIGGATNVNVTFDCSAQTAGIYTGTLILNHSDPLGGLYAMPVELACGTVFPSIQTGNWSGSAWTSGVPTATDVVTITAGTTVTLDSASAQCYRLFIEDGGTLIMPEGNVVSVEDRLVNNGRIVQTRTVADSTPTEFLHLTDQSGNEDKYYGAVITPDTTGLGETTVTVWGNHESTTADEPGDTENRRIDIDVAAQHPATVRFYYLQSELEAAHDYTQVRAWHWSEGSGWSLAGTGATTGSTGDYYYVQESGISAYSPFVLKDSSTQAPTATTVAAVAGWGGELALLVLTGLLVAGASLYRKRR